MTNLETLKKQDFLTALKNEFTKTTFTNNILKKIDFNLTEDEIISYLKDEIIKNQYLIDIEDTKNLFEKTINVLNSIKNYTKEELKDFEIELKVLGTRKSSLERDMHKIDFTLKYFGNKPINKNFKTKVDEIMALNSKYSRNDYKKYQVIEISSIADKATNLLFLMESTIKVLKNRIEA